MSCIKSECNVCRRLCSSAISRTTKLQLFQCTTRRRRCWPQQANQLPYHVRTAVPLQVSVTSDCIAEATGHSTPANAYSGTDQYRAAVFQICSAASDCTYSCIHIPLYCHYISLNSCSANYLHVIAVCRFVCMNASAAKWHACVRQDN